jgi:glucitol operon activator protein
MDQWGILIIFFVFAWVLQVILSYYQNKHYGQTIRKMSAAHDSGYLGVGVIKKRLGIGSVVILVSDLSGLVVDAKELTGVTVFSRFTSNQELNGKKIEQLFALSGRDHRTKAIQMAANQIVNQKNQQEQRAKE